MNEHIDIQRACDYPVLIDDLMFMQWINHILPADKKTADITLRLVDTDEMTELNTTYRKQNKPTNVLAFPSSLPEDIMATYPFLGDVIICPEVLLSESNTTHVPLTAHYAHIVIHGVLHLLGFDHQNEHDTPIMQSLEINALSQLGFDNPYAKKDPSID